MSAGCKHFRAALAEALASPRRPTGAGKGAASESLGWHAHLRSCAACRELLEAEQALDEVLASLPEPRLPADLARRVLARLEALRGEELPPDEAALERLLALDSDQAVPPRLAERVLAGLAADRVESVRPAAEANARADRDAERTSARLDALLTVLPAPALPVGLAARVLARLAPEREGLAQAQPTPALARPVRGTRPRTSATATGPRPESAGVARLVASRTLQLAALAAGLLLALGIAWVVLGGLRRSGPRPEIEPRIAGGAETGTEERAPSPRPVPAPAPDPMVAPQVAVGGEPGPTERVVSPEADPPTEPGEGSDVDPELLAALDVLENWEAVTDDDLDLWLGELDALDWALIEHAAPAADEKEEG